MSDAERGSKREFPLCEGSINLIWIGPSVFVLDKLLVCREKCAPLQFRLHLDIPLWLDPAEIGAPVIAQRFFGIKNIGAAWVAHENYPMPEGTRFLHAPFDGEQGKIGQSIPGLEWQFTALG